MIRRPPRSTPLYSSAASDVYKRQVRAGLSCIEESGVCAASFPPWAGPPYSFLMGGVIGGLILYFVANVCSQLGLSRCHQAGLSRVARADREVLTTGRSFQFPERLVVLENSTPTSYTCLLYTSP